MIGQSFKAEIIDQRKITKFSVLIDESTDNFMYKGNVHSYQIYYSSLGQVVSEFFEMKNIFGSDVPKNVEGSTAENLYATLMEVSDKSYILRENIIGFGSDGCNVMMGEHNSVVSRFKSDLP